MNVYELDGCTLDLLYEDVSDANRTAYAAAFLRSYNKAYGELQRTRFRPYRWEQVTLDDHGFSLSSLSETCRGVIKVTAAKDYSPEAGLHESPGYAFVMQDPDTVVLPAYEGDTAWVLYYHRYPDLVNDTPTVDPSAAGPANTPQIPEEAHMLLCLMAAADFCRRRRRGDLADLNMSEYYRTLQTLRAYEPQSPARGLRNLYLDQRGWKLNG